MREHDHLRRERAPVVTDRSCHAFLWSVVFAEVSDPTLATVARMNQRDGCH